MDQKLENILNLALETPEEERKQTESLNVGYSAESRSWELIVKYQIETQEELAEYLKKAGYHVTQATVSRDIRELKLTKAPGKNGRQCYAVMQHLSLIHI